MVRLSRIVFAVLLCAILSGCGTEARLSVGTGAKATARQSQRQFRFFAPASFWNTRLERNQQLDPQSTELVAAFASEVQTEAEKGHQPWINTTDYSVPVYKVPRYQPTLQVKLASQYHAPALQAAWRRVPLPPDASPSEGSDGNLVVYQPSTDRLWEFWRLRSEGSRWEASWGGAIHDVSHSSGAYGPKAWAGAKPWWGSSASSLSIAGGLITFADLHAGRIDHALALAIPTVRRGVFASPARRSDGTALSPLALPEGAHLRLDPGLDLEALNLPPLTLTIARAAKHYGIFVRDRAGVTHFFAQGPSSLPGNPYLGEEGFFEGMTPGELLAFFPWPHLQVLPMKLHAHDSTEPSGTR
jgi:hypothetical protein